MKWTVVGVALTSLMDVALTYSHEALFYLTTCLTGLQLEVQVIDETVFYIIVLFKHIYFNLLLV
jgi:hypothetical protein